MTQHLTDIAKYVYNNTGRDISVLQPYFLNQIINKRGKENNIANHEEYLVFLQSKPFEINKLLASLFNYHSIFFRSPLTFNVLETVILPSLINKLTNLNREIRIWSAGCAAGQEAYSIAILMNELKKNQNNNLRFRIFASDQSEIMIKQAKAGIFNETYLGNLTIKRLSKWFIKETNNNYRVNDTLTENIDFSVFDLTGKHSYSPPTSIYGDFDLIICANLLFYYKQKVTLEIISRLRQSLESDGYMVLSNTEREIMEQINYYEVFPMTSIYKQKTK